MGRPRIYSDEERKNKKNERQRMYRADPKNRTVEKHREYDLIPEIKIRNQFTKSTYWKKYYPQNKDGIIENAGIRFQQNKDEIYLKINPRRNEKYYETRKSLFNLLGGHICKQCKFTDPRALNIDHVDNTGYLDDKRFDDDRQRNAYYLKHIDEAINHLQILCSNCNRIKEYERKKGITKSDKPRNIKSRDKYQKLKDKVIQILGGYICNQCKFEDGRALDIDHIRGNGRLDRNQYGRYDQFLQNIVENPNESKQKLQIMCRNCNEIKKKNAESVSEKS